VNHDPESDIFLKKVLTHTLLSREIPNLPREFTVLSREILNLSKEFTVLSRESQTYQERTLFDKPSIDKTPSTENR
jgi:hypothetical protein